MGNTQKNQDLSPIFDFDPDRPLPPELHLLVHRSMTTQYDQTHSYYRRKRLEFICIDFSKRLQIFTPKINPIRVCTLHISLGDLNKNSNISYGTLSTISTEILKFKNVEILSLKFINQNFNGLDSVLSGLFSRLSKLKRLRSLKIVFHSCSYLLSPNLSRGIQHMSHLKDLQVICIRSYIGANNGNNGSYNVIPKLIACLYKLPSLQGLTFCFEGIDTFDTTLNHGSLFHAVLYLSHLRNLTLKFNYMGIPKEDFDRFRRQLVHRNSTKIKALSGVRVQPLETLCLEFNNKFISTTEEDLLASLDNTHKALSVTTKFGNTSVHQLKSLSLAFSVDSDSEISEIQLLKFAESLGNLKDLKALKVLLFNHRWKFSVLDRILTAFVDSISNLQSLHCLKLEINLPIYEEHHGIINTMISAICSLKQLRELNLNVPTSYNKQLKRRVTSIKQLAHNLPKLCHLEVLDLCFSKDYYFSKKDDIPDLSDLMFVVRKLTKLKRFSLGTNNLVSPMCLQILGQTLRNLEDLQSVQLMLGMLECKLDDEEILRFGACLVGLKHLRVLILNLEASIAGGTEESFQVLKDILGQLEQLELNKKNFISTSLFFSY